MDYILEALGICINEEYLTSLEQARLAGLDIKARYIDEHYGTNIRNNVAMIKETIIKLSKTEQQLVNRDIGADKGALVYALAHHIARVNDKLEAYDDKLSDEDKKKFESIIKIVKDFEEKLK